MEQSHAEMIDRAFTDQASSFNASAIANADEILGAIVEQADPRPSERWLEAACGPGVVSRRLATVAGSVHGIDLTSAMIETAEREAAAAGLKNVTFEVGDATRTTLADGSFDGAVTRFSLHHIPVPGRLIDELARVLRPGGKLVVVDHLADDDGEVRAWAQEIERLRDPSHWASLSASRLRSLGRAAGLELAREQVFSFELDFDDWLRRGTQSTVAQELVERSLATAPAESDCFRVSADGRILQMQMWLGVWHQQ